MFMYMVLSLFERKKKYRDEDLGIYSCDMECIIIFKYYNVQLNYNEIYSNLYLSILPFVTILNTTKFLLHNKI